MASEQSSQSIHISGGQFSTVQLGQAGRDLSQIQDLSQNSAQIPTAEEVIALLA